MNLDPPQLDQLRRAIDAIDDQLHDLLMKRTELAGQITAAKRAARPAVDGAGFMRPGREAQVIRRLIARHHGPFPRLALVRLWREIMSAFVGLQTPFTVAVLAAPAEPGYWDLARDHFGLCTPLVGYQSAGQVLSAVAEGAQLAGVLPLPRVEEVEPWWAHLASDDPATPRIIARLPFAIGASIHGGSPAALVFAVGVPVEETDGDRTCLVVETDTPISRGALGALVTAAQLHPAAIAAGFSPTERHPTLFLVEVEGLVTGGDPRLAALVARGSAIHRVVVAGAYAEPLQLDVSDADNRR